MGGPAFKFRDPLLLRVGFSVTVLLCLSKDLLYFLADNLPESCRFKSSYISSSKTVSTFNMPIFKKCKDYFHALINKLSIKKGKLKSIKNQFLLWRLRNTCFQHFGNYKQGTEGAKPMLPRLQQFTYVTFSFTSCPDIKLYVVMSWTLTNSSKTGWHYHQGAKFQMVITIHLT